MNPTMYAHGMETSVRVDPPFPFIPTGVCRFCDSALDDDGVDRDGWRVCYDSGWHRATIMVGVTRPHRPENAPPASSCGIAGGGGHNASLQPGDR